MVPAEVFLAIDSLRPPASTAHQGKDCETVVAEPMRFCREGPSPELIVANVRPVGNNCERRGIRADGRIERRFQHDRTGAVGGPNREMRNPHALARPGPFNRPIARRQAPCVGADKRPGGNTAVLKGCGHEEPVRAVEGVSKGAKSGQGQHAVDDPCFVAPPLAARAVKCQVRFQEDSASSATTISGDALDHEDMPVVMPGPNPCALKACDLGRHISAGRLHVERIRQRNDRLRIDCERPRPPRRTGPS